MSENIPVFVMLCLVLAMLCSMECPAATPPPFKVGIELPTQTPVRPAVQTALKDIGISYFNSYVYNASAEDLPAAETNRAMIELANALGVDYSIACHHVDAPDDCVKAGVAMGRENGRFRGVVIDELEHCRLLWLYSQFPVADASKFGTLDNAYDQTLAGYRKLHAKYSALGAQPVATHIWPVMEHIAARAGFTVCPKICKELYSSVSLAIGMGAAKQYGTDLWADCDLWFWDMIPGHTADEMKSNLLLAYWLGTDLVYVEGCGYNLRPAGKQGTPFSIMNVIDDTHYQLTPHGEALRWFCKEYLPAHPRQWTFRDVKPNIAIVRFEDTCHGQRYTGDFPDKLYGSDKLKSNADTEAWFALWNLLTFGKTGRDGLSFFKAWVSPYGYQRGVSEPVLQSYLSRPLSADVHRFFVPLNGVVVYDHLASYNLLKDTPLLFLTGTRVSDDTMAALRKCVNEGAVCVAWGPLAAKHGFTEWKSGVSVVPEGKGRFVLTDDFGLQDVYKQVAGLLGHPDEIHYKFGERDVVLRRVTDNEVSVEIK